MGLFDKLKKTSSVETVPATSDDTSSMTLTNSNEQARKKSLWAKYQDAKRGPGLANMSDEDLKKYTGMDRAEFDKWSATTPGVAGGQAAGSHVGPVSGLGGSAAADGLFGWGTDAGKYPRER